MSRFFETGFAPLGCQGVALKGRFIPSVPQIFLKQESYIGNVGDGWDREGIVGGQPPQRRSNLQAQILTEA